MLPVNVHTGHVQVSSAVRVADAVCYNAVQALHMWGIIRISLLHWPHHALQGLQMAQPLSYARLELAACTGSDYVSTVLCCALCRDLKSKNILLTKGGDAKISDVGMAKIMAEGYLTMDKAIGTFAWAAPELILGEK